MTDSQYLDVKLKLRDTESVVLTPGYLSGCILNSLDNLFGEIGGRTSLDIVKFSAADRRLILRVPQEFVERARIAVTLIGHYQEVPCHFQVLKTSNKQLDFDDVGL
ncbi:uncharacterized protein LOC117582873 [Drosophila guanche]|uniref:Uncharacterized protein n=1 Tax=Drosophila guanche TaxID=7266 RepID=A0A3B0JJK3_DROGU|nr:uncharacterized protein LOC117582873 [Drosophila guanche]SPP80953.1 Hypothetical predicted protein [Drosophila guanche]